MMRWRADQSLRHAARSCGWRVAALAVGVLLSSNARAESLNEALAKTYRTNPDLAAERAAVREADEGVSQANARWRPSLAVEAEYERESARVKDHKGKFDLRSETWSADLVMTQPLFTGGRNGARKDAAVAGVRAARARLRAKEQRVLIDAVVAFNDVGRNEAVADLVRADITLLQDLLKEVGERRDRGHATDSDVDQTLAALSAARSQCIARFAGLEDSWRAYEQVVGERPALGGTPDAEGPRVNPCIDAKGERQRSTIVLSRDLPATPGSLEEVETAAQGAVPELDEARAEDEAARHAVAAAYAELAPSAELTARIGTSGQEFDPQYVTREASIGAELVIPIFNTGAEWSEIRAAREAGNRARLNITSAQRQVMRDAAHAWYELVSIRAVRSVNKMQLEALGRAFEGMRREIADDPKLHRSMTDLLALRGALLGAQTVLVANDRDEAVAVYRLLGAMGKLNAAHLALPVEIYDATANLKAQATRIIGDTIAED